MRTKSGEEVKRIEVKQLSCGKYGCVALDKNKNAILVQIHEDPNIVYDRMMEYIQP